MLIRLKDRYYKEVCVLKYMSERPQNMKWWPSQNTY